jgi:type 1 fimbria pilin
MRKYILAFLFFAFTLSAFAQNNWQASSFETDKVKIDLKIYPNPCKNSKVTIDYQSKEISEIRLTNITGKQVLLKKYDFPVHKTQIQLNTIPNGIYLVQIKTRDNKLTVKILMVSKI